MVTVSRSAHNKRLQQSMLRSAAEQQALSVMIKYKVILLILAMVLTGCAKSKTEFSVLPEDFAHRFDRLFLSEEPLRYQDNAALLKAIKIEQLSQSEKKIIRIKIKKFLSSGYKNRGYTKDSHLTGVASPYAFLRLQSIQLLGEIGEKEDINYIESLREKSDTEHPLFKEERNKAIEIIKAR